MGNRTRWVAGIGAAVALIATLAACTAGSSSSSLANSSSSSSSSSEMMSAAAAAPAAGSAAATSAAGTTSPKAPAGGRDVAVTPVDRSVIRIATVALQVDVRTTGKGAQADADAQVTAVGRVADNVRTLTGPDGYVQASSGGGTTQSVVLRVAPNSYSSVFTALQGLGSITSRNEQAQDVTGQLVDLTSRMKTMKASVDRVRLLLSKADKVGDVVAIESELTQREADLESLESQQAALSGQVALSTITVQITSRLTGVPAPVPAAAPAPAPTGFVAGLQSGWHALKAFVKVVLQIVGAVLPFTPILLVGVIALLWWRRRQRRVTVPPVAPSAE